MTSKIQDRLVIFAIAFTGALAGANVTPLLTGSGKILFPEASPAAAISASSGSLTIAAGGVGNQNVNITPTGLGTVNIGAGTGFGAAQTVAIVPNLGTINSYDSGGTSRTMIVLGNENPDALHIRNAQRGTGGPIQFEGVGGSVRATINSNTALSRFGDAAAPSYAVDSAGDVNATGVFRKAGTAGVGVGSAVTVCSVVSGGVCTSSCTLIFQGGIRTGGTCPV